MARTFSVTSGSQLRCRGWRQEGLLRLLENVLAVGEDPNNLIVYAALGRAARDWPSHDRIVATLKTLEEGETLLVQSGKPIGVIRTHAKAPLVIMANCNMKGSSAADVGRLWRACAEAEAPAIEALLAGTRIAAVDVPWGPWSARSAPTRVLICSLLTGELPPGPGEIEAFCLAAGRSEEPGAWVLHAPMASGAADLARNPALALALGFSGEDLAALELGRLDEVIQRRNRWMRGRLEEFLAARCALRLPDAPAMETLRDAWSTTP